MARWQRALGDGNDILFQVYYDRTILVTRPALAETRDTVDVDFLHRHSLPARQRLPGP